MHTAEAGIDLAPFEQRGADAPGEAAQRLAPGGSDAQDPPAVEHAEGSGYPDGSEARVDTDLDELCSVSHGHEVVVLRARHGQLTGLHALDRLLVLVRRRTGYPLGESVPGQQPVQVDSIGATRVDQAVAVDPCLAHGFGGAPMRYREGQ